MTFGKIYNQPHPNIPLMIFIININGEIKCLMKLIKKRRFFL